eukprot:8724439-Pyramimonas_sp.AAC.2
MKKNKCRNSVAYALLKGVIKAPREKSLKVIKRKKEQGRTKKAKKAKERRSSYDEDLVMPFDRLDGLRDRKRKKPR